MKNAVATAALAALASTVALAAVAQPGKQAKPPIDIVSDEQELLSASCTATFTGSPEALQDGSRLRAEVMIAHEEILSAKEVKATPGASRSSQCGETISVEANGSVYYQGPDGRRIRSDHAFYDAVTNMLTMTGDVIAVKGDDVTRGSQMTYNTKTGNVHVEGTGKGPGSKGRARGVFYPKASPDEDDSSKVAGPKKPSN